MATGVVIGIIIGIIIALPTGPVALLCLRKTLLFGKKSGFLSVFGSLFADLFFSSVVVFSLTFIIRFFTDFSNILQLLGGILFLIIAWKAKKMVVDDSKVTLPLKTPVGDFMSTFTLTFTNPTFIFSLSFIFALLNVENYTSTINEKIVFLVGTVVGSFVWWVIFVYTADIIHRKKAGGISLHKINGISAVVFAIIGAFFIATSITRYIF